MTMQYNVCETCGASNGRAGNLISMTGESPSECMNCYDTRRTGDLTIHANLNRTQEELAKTTAILNPPQLAGQKEQPVCWVCNDLGVEFSDTNVATPCSRCAIEAEKAEVLADLSHRPAPVTPPTPKKKRVSTPHAQPGQLLVQWGLGEPGNGPDLQFCFGEDTGRRDNAVILSAFGITLNSLGKTLKQELEERGYDLTTLKFSISKKAEDPNATYEVRVRHENGAWMDWEPYVDGQTDMSAKEYARHYNGEWRIV